MAVCMRIFICLLGFVFINTVLAKETETTENMAPVFEPITQDIGGRLEKLEKMLDNTALLDMLELLESLKVEVSTLRGEIEVQTHTIDQLKQKQRDLYTDIDRRLMRFESNKTAADLPTQIETLNTVANQEESSGEDTVGEQGLVIETTSDIVSYNEISGNEEATDPLKAEAVYQRAFKLLKQSQYDQALKAFKGFLKKYPDSAFSDNAQYWLGEANYVMQKYELAINEYQALLNTYPDSQKVSHALLKIGYSYAELGNATDAKKTLEEVKRQYPGTTAARLADERLRRISAAKKSST
ncbi:MAG: tol-pal system protein YbgF [Proteobacteria bacterium]|nr:tol-pal system protein YbgF [Pseudomonadota bacterium]